MKKIKNKIKLEAPKAGSLGEKKYILAEKTIELMLKKNQKINFVSVSRESGISRSFLYDYTKMVEKIETYRDTQLNGAKVRNKIDDANKDVLLLVLEKKIKKLEESILKKDIEIKALNKELDRFKLLVYEG